MKLNEALIYIKSDLIRYTGQINLKCFFKTYFRESGFKFSFWLRLCKVDFFIIKFFAKLMRLRLATKFQIIIQARTKIGYGLYLGHGMSIVINPTTTIGNNVNLSQFTSIGSNHNNAATIGDNVYIGPNVCIIENVQIGNNATIGASAVVTRDIPENATVVGSPAKIISFENPGLYVGSRWGI